MKQYKHYDTYTVQPEGLVISHYNRAPLTVALYKKNKQGKDVLYPRVRLSHKGKASWHALGRVIAECFIPNPDNLPHVNHKDGNRLNNHYTNLEWCTHLDNIKHSVDNGLNPKGERQGIAVATELLVREIRRLRKESSMTYPEIAHIVGLRRRTVEAIGSGQNWKHVI